MDKRLPSIRKALAFEDEYLKEFMAEGGSDTGMSFFITQPVVSSGDVSVCPVRGAGKEIIEVKTPIYTLKIDPAAGGRICGLESGKTELCPDIQGIGLDAFWWPHAMILDTIYRLKDVSESGGGVKMTFTRTINKRDRNTYYEGLVIDRTYEFSKDSFVIRTEISNPTDKTIPFAFRFHSLSGLSMLRNNESGTALMDNNGTKIIHKRGSFREIFCMPGAQDRDMEHRMEKKHAVSSPVVEFSASWSNVKLVAEVLNPADLYGFVFWDSDAQKYTSFEPLYRKTELAPGKTFKASMSYKLGDIK